MKTVQINTLSLDDEFVYKDQKYKVWINTPRIDYIVGMGGNYERFVEFSSNPSWGCIPWNTEVQVEIPCLTSAT